MAIVVYYDSIIGCDEKIYLAATESGLCFVSNDYDEMIVWLARRDFTSIVHAPLKMKLYVEEFSKYFQGLPIDFTSLPLDIVGTEFQQKVWHALRQISYGEVCTYSDVANAIHKPTAVRAVASAIGKNPLLVMIPCHRVIGKNGKLTGFRSGLALKERLLYLEQH